MNQMLRDLIGQRVEVWDAQNTFHDRGMLVGYEEPWVRLENEDGVLCFPVYNIRLLKLLRDQ